MKAMKAMLVYQAGIANVFRVGSFGLTPESRVTTERLLQCDFRTCESFIRGMKAAGCQIKVAACNQAGDIINSEWSYDLESQPFSESFRLK